MLRLISTLTVIDAYAFKRFDVSTRLFAPYDRETLGVRFLCDS